MEPPIIVTTAVQDNLNPTSMKNSHLVRTSLLLSVAFICKLTSGQLLAAEEQKPEQRKPTAAGQAEKVRTLGIVLFPSFELLDAYGPLEMWGI